MGIEALTHDDAGKLHVPESEDAWREWISGTRTRAHAIGDPVIDWLEAYGARRGYPRDSEVPGYDPRTDFTDFIPISY